MTSEPVISHSWRQFTTSQQYVFCYRLVVCPKNLRKELGHDKIVLVELIAEHCIIGQAEIDNKSFQTGCKYMWSLCSL